MRSFHFQDVRAGETWEEVQNDIRDVTHQAETDGAGETEVLFVAPDLSVGEEENHGEEGTDDLRRGSAVEG